MDPAADTGCKVEGASGTCDDREAEIGTVIGVPAECVAWACALIRDVAEQLFDEGVVLYAAVLCQLAQVFGLSVDEWTPYGSVTACTHVPSQLQQ